MAYVNGSCICNIKLRLEHLHSGSVERVREMLQITLQWHYKQAKNKTVSSKC
jgi:hypothetical protein